MALSENYHPKWRLEMKAPNTKFSLLNWLPFAKVDAVKDSDHLKLNDFQNGWYVDSDIYCKTKNLCQNNADGSYDMEMIAEFTPQRWLNGGLIIGIGSVLAFTTYVVYRPSWREKFLNHKRAWKLKR